MEPDFSGYATRNGLKCSDGRTILQNAFKGNDGQKVPLVWNHQHDEAGNVLGHALLENRDDGVYAYCYLNGNQQAMDAKELVRHGDINSLSIHANKLVQKGLDVLHGVIREVSLVMAGANPGAYIENVNLQHSDDGEVLEGEAVIYTGMELAHADDSTEGETVADTKENEKTLQQVYDSMSEEQKNAVAALLAQAVSEDNEESDSDNNDSASHSSEDENDEALQHSQEGDNMSRNVFQHGDTPEEGEATLTHAQTTAIFNDAEKIGSLKESVLAHAEQYGITNIDKMFPSPTNVQSSPEWIKRRTEWVADIINGTKKSPFSRIKSMSADITHEEARAKGYIKGNLKKDEFFALKSRSTTPTTVYKKQKLDRDDIIDVTDLDVVAWIKAEMRMMLDEEIARAILLGDGRSVEDEDKIKDPASLSDGKGIRSIANDDTFYAHQVTVPANVSLGSLEDMLVRERRNYKGSGNPVLYTTEDVLTDLLLQRDKMGRRLYDTEAALASALRVSKIVPVEAMEEAAYEGLLGIMVNISDYTVGADKGGNISMFDDFDIDYNQHKYLIETRISGALTKHKTAVVIRRAKGTEVTAEAPSFNPETNEITIPTTTGVTYLIDGQAKTGKVTIAEDTWVDAEAKEGYFLKANSDTTWAFEFNAEAGAGA